MTCHVQDFYCMYKMQLKSDLDLSLIFFFEHFIEKNIKKKQEAFLMSIIFMHTEA